MDLNQTVFRGAHHHSLTGIAMAIIENNSKLFLEMFAKNLESNLGCNVISYYGEINPAFLKLFRNFIETTVDRYNEENAKTDELAIVLTTPGGSVQAVEKMVQILRHHYLTLSFIVPDQAMSAGTIFCMAGDKIFMDYTSSLGPIDPQVPIGNGNSWVPALGYLDKYEELIAKARESTLTDVEFAMLTNQDLAQLRSYEQARDLTISLLKDWLVKYKFKNWTKHRTHDVGEAVSSQEKEARAEEIAQKLGDNKIWHSHGRLIGIDTLKDTLKLEIEDYTEDKEKRIAIRQYNDLLSEFFVGKNLAVYMHSRVFSTL